MTSFDEERLCNVTTNGNQCWPSIVATHDGGYMMFWAGIGCEGSGIYFNRYDRYDNCVIQERKISDTGFGHKESQSIMLNSGRILVVWSQVDGSGYEHPRMKLVGEDGVVIGEEKLILHGCTEIIHFIFLLQMTEDLLLLGAR